MNFKTIIIAFISLILFIITTGSVSFACTQDELIQKANELSTAFQETAMKDPGKAQAVMDKVQEIQSKLQDVSDSAELCKAYDEMLSIMK